MNKQPENSNNNAIHKNIKRLLMFKGLSKIHSYIEKEKKYKKAEEIFAIIVILLILAFFIFSSSTENHTTKIIGFIPDKISFFSFTS